MAKYKKEDFISKCRLQATAVAVEEIKKKAETTKRTRKDVSGGGSPITEKRVLSGDLNTLTGLLVNAVIMEELDTEKAKETLMNVISLWENSEDSRKIVAEFQKGMRFFAKNNAEKIWSQFFGNVYPDKTVVSWEIDDAELKTGFGGIIEGKIPLYEGQEMEVSTRLRPKGVMDGKTPFGGLLNNARFAVLAKEDPKLGAYMFSEALQIMREHSELSNGGIRGAHFEASMISTRNFLEFVEELDGRSLNLISREILLIVNSYINFRRSVMTGEVGKDIMSGLSVPSKIDDKESLIIFMNDVIKRVLNRNGDVFSTASKVKRAEVANKADELAKYGIYATTVLMNMQYGINK